MARTKTLLTTDDPLSLALRPPVKESPAAKAERLKTEQAAAKRSEAIDKKLKEEAQQMRKERSNEQLLLLLGQAGAGKTTVLKQMRLMYDPEAHARDKDSWRQVVYLNVIVALRELLEALDEAALEPGPPPTARRKAEDLAALSNDQAVLRAEGSRSRGGSAGSGATGSTTGGGAANVLLLAKLRLAPLLSLEAPLRVRLGAFDEDAVLPAGSWSQRSPLSPSGASSSIPLSPSGRSVDGSAWNVGRRVNTIMLRAGWQQRLMSRKSISSIRSHLTSRPSGEEASADRENGPSPTKTRSRSRSVAASGLRRSKKAGNEANLPEEESVAALEKANTLRVDEADDPGPLLRALRAEVLELWNSPPSLRLRRKGKLESSDTTSYFLGHIDRLAQPDYSPSDEDVMHARVRTVGITEERFQVAKNAFYRICDVGGSRVQRAVWASFFTDARAIIFLAPLSAFDQRLVEDPKVNRMADSLAIYSDIVTNPLLKSVSLIVFLNKMDILERKLAAGVLVSRHWPEYGGDAKDFEQVWRFFRQKFKEINSQARSKNVAPGRPTYFHTVVATSTRQVRAILSSVNDTILRESLAVTGLT